MFHRSWAALKKEIARVKRMQKEAVAAQEKAARIAGLLARLLAKKMSVRDVGAVLGISGQRVQQLVHK